ncbi:MAG TPA: DUF4198 domain-containing protein [Chitinophagaceae bacterium]
MKKLLLTSGLLFTVALMSGHEFWLHPEKFYYRTGELVNIKCLSGENYEGKNWTGDRSKIKNLRLYYADVVDECSTQLSENGKGDSLRMAFFEEGTMMFTFNNHNSFIELDSEKFNAYLKEDGLQEVIDYRASHNESDSGGREYYQRCVKTLVQVGDKKTSTYKKRTSLAVDIVPEENPYSLNDGEKLKVKLYFQNKPMVNALVRVWHRNNEQTVKRDLQTNDEGEIEFPVFVYGRWMISSVKMVRLEKDPKATWQSYWGSLTWGYIR